MERWEGENTRSRPWNSLAGIYFRHTEDSGNILRYNGTSRPGGDIMARRRAIEGREEGEKGEDGGEDGEEEGGEGGRGRSEKREKIRGS